MNPWLFGINVAAMVGYPLSFDNRRKTLTRIFGSESDAMDAMVELGEAVKKSH